MEYLQSVRSLQLLEVLLGTSWVAGISWSTLDLMVNPSQFLVENCRRTGREGSRNHWPGKESLTKASEIIPQYCLFWNACREPVVKVKTHGEHESSCCLMTYLATETKGEETSPQKRSSFQSYELADASKLPCVCSVTTTTLVTQKNNFFLKFQWQLICLPIRSSLLSKRHLGTFRKVLLGLRSVQIKVSALVRSRISFSLEST